MLSGLLFAIDDADDRPGRLTATLPFAGVTLIEYQARLLIAAGAAQIIIVVARLTPELLGAIARIAQRGVVVDTVRSAVEAAEKLHPLSRLVVLADGLITTEDTIAHVLRDTGHDALMVVPEAGAEAGLERVGSQMAWAGVARLDPRRVAEVAALPRDYDLQSTLLRLAAQARATHILLPADAEKAGHGIVHRAETLDARGRAVVARLVSGRRSWFDRYILAPIARLALPRLVERSVPAHVAGGVGGGAGLLGLILILTGFPGLGLFLAMIGTLGLGLGETLAGLRDEQGAARALSAAIAVLTALAIMALGWQHYRAWADDLGLAMALVLVVLGILAERAALYRFRRRWWASPPAYLLVILPATLLGIGLWGLVLASIYAIATLASAIETLRAQV
ncbi:Flp pilus assembly pilin Flp [Sphingomonas sp. SORGH_AS 950]|nr:Flp pilus assembly pilin Flp [Sphingomonas sp. SORGH_AS_0950]